MKSNLIFGFALVSMLGGCVTATSPDISEMSIADVCVLFKQNKARQNAGAFVRFIANAPYNPQYAEELERRKFFTDEEMTLIREEKIEMGMRSELLRCIFGYPSDINRTVTQYGTSEQWVFRNSDWYVYVEDGVVTSWQN